MFVYDRTFHCGSNTRIGAWGDASVLLGAGIRLREVVPVFESCNIILSHGKVIDARCGCVD